MKKDEKYLLGGILVVLFVIGGGMTMLEGYMGSSTGDDGTIGTTSSGEPCAVASAIRLSGTNEITGTSVSDYNAIMFRSGIQSAEQLVSTDATFEVSANEPYEFLIKGSATYYPIVKGGVSGTAICDSDQLKGVSLRAVGSASTFILKDDGITEMANGSEEAIGSGESDSFRVKLSGATDNAYFGMDGIAVCLDYNGSAFTRVETSMQTAGRTMTAISTPFGQTSQDTTNNLYNKCYEINGLLVEDEEVQFDILTTASSVTPPAGVDTSNIGIRVVDSWYMQNDSGAWVSTYFDPDTGAVLGATDITDLVHTT